MADLVEKHSGGWPITEDANARQRRQADAQVGRERALELGATD
jgi:hypothetical protein